MSAPRKIEGERVWFFIVTSVICWPIQALGLMVGVGLLRAEGFDLPAIGYWSSFIVILGVTNIYTGVTLTRDVLKRSKLL